MTDGEKILELHLAKQIAAKNPKLALKLGRASLAKGLSPELVSVIAQLKSTDKEASATLYKEIVDKLKSVNMDQDSTAILIAVTLVRSHPPPATDELVYRDLVGLLLTSALSAGCAEAKKDYTPQICFDIRSVVPQMEKYYASRAGQLRRWPQIEQGHDDSSEEVWEDVRQVTREGTVNEILALANKYPEISSQVHWAAVRKAEESGDVARARQIASEYPDPEQRREMLAQIERDQMWKSVNAEKLAAIQQQLSRLRNNYERINFLFHMAGQIGANDRKAALGLLNQASQMIDSNKSGKAQLETQIRLAMHFSYLKSDRGFAIMESVLPKLNQLITAAAALDGFENNYLRDGEWNMSSEGTVGRLLTDLAQSARVFGSFDFDRSVTMAGQFERPEIRLMAQLKIAQGVLAKQPNVVLTFQRE